MTFTWDFNIATLVSIGVLIVTFIIYLVRTNGTAKDALRLANASGVKADEAHEKISVLNAALHLHREQIARDYHDKHELRQMEQRLEGALKEMEKRLTGQISELRAHPHPHPHPHPPTI